MSGHDLLGFGLSGFEWIPASVIAAAFLGSLHCVSMCGPLILAAAPKPRDVLFYQLGRLIGYVSLGALSGFLGGWLLSAESSAGLSMGISWLAAVGMSVSFVYLGVLAWKGKAPHAGMPRWLRFRWLGALARAKSPGWVGLLSVFLPCGWLHSFALAAAATQSALSGAVFMAAFWLGSLPALSVGAIVIRGILSPLKGWSQKLAAVLLVVAGLAAVGSKLAQPRFDPGAGRDSASGTEEHGSCH